MKPWNLADLGGLAFVSAIVSSAVFVACAEDLSAPDPAAGMEFVTADSALVAPDDPVRGPDGFVPPSFFGFIPPLPGHAGDSSGWSRIPDDALGAPITSGEYLNGRDLAGPPTPSSAAWLSAARGDEYSSVPAFEDYLEFALDDAEGRTDALDDNKALFGAIRDLFGIPDEYVGERGRTATFRGWDALRARWRAEETRCLGPFCWFEVPWPLPDPPHFDEQRRRGARLYCAAVEAARQAPSGAVLMGRDSLAEFSIIGRRFRLLAVAPTVTPLAPERFVGSGPDGAEAFAVPYELGVVVWPLEGLLPALPELRHTVTLVSGESEVINRADLGAVRAGWGLIRDPNSFFGFRFGPRYVNDLRNAYQTASHVDAIVGRSQELFVDPPIVPLFSLLGRVNVGLDLSLDIVLGDDASSYGPDNARLIDTPASGWPAARTDEPPDVLFSDQLFTDTAAWRLDSLLPDGDGAVANSDDATREVDMGADSPWLVRATQDDDHTYRAVTTVTVDGRIAAEVDTGGPLRILARIDGGISGSAGVIHRVTDRLELETSFRNSLGPARPVSNMSITPQTTADLRLNSSFALTVILDLGFFGKVTLLSVNETLANEPLAEFTSEPWGEESVFRLQHGAAAGDVRDQPDAWSKWPQDVRFASFPVDVDACLASTPELPEPAPRCEPSRQEPEPTPDVNACTFMRKRLLGAFPTNSDEHMCIEDLLAWHAGGISREQVIVSTDVVARLLDPDDLDAVEELQDIMVDCISVFDGDASVVLGFIDGSLCDETATLQGSLFDIDEADSAGNPGDEPADRGGSCE